MWVKRLAWLRLPGSLLHGKQLCCRQRRGFNTLIVCLSPGSPFSPSAPSIAWSGIRRRQRGGKNGEEPSTCRGLVQCFMISGGFFSPELLLTFHSVARLLSSWQQYHFNRILTPQLGILQIKVDIFGALAFWHFPV